MAMSWEQRRELVRTALRVKYAEADWLYIEAMFDAEVVFEMRPKATPIAPEPPCEYWRTTWSLDEATSVVTLGDAPERVREEKSYVSFAHRDQHDAVDFRFADTQRYPTEEKDGLWAMRGVPVFKLGTSRGGFNYTSAWGDSLVSNMAAEKASTGYLPTVIKGHTADGVEPKAEAFLDNIRRDGLSIVADFVDMPSGLFGEIQAGNWPYRSVEIMPAAAMMQSVALLGGSMPFHRDKPLAFGTGAGARMVMWTPGGDGVEIAPKEDRMSVAAGAGGGAPKDGAGVAGPDQIARMSELERTNTEQKEQLARMAEQLRKSEVEKFGAKLRGLGFTPAVIESPVLMAEIDRFSRSTEVVKFGAEDAAGLDRLGKIVELFAEQGRKSALFVPATGSVVEVGATSAPPAGAEKFAMTDAEVKKFGPNADPESVKVYRFVERIAAAKKISFEDAHRMAISGGITEAELKTLEGAK